jgi:hypothetical protein
MNHIHHGIKEAPIEIDVVEGILLVGISQHRLDSAGMAPDCTVLLHHAVDTCQRNACGSRSTSIAGPVVERYVGHVRDLLAVIFELPSTVLLSAHHHHGSSSILHTLSSPLPDVVNSDP